MSLVAYSSDSPSRGGRDATDYRLTPDEAAARPETRPAAAPTRVLERLLRMQNAEIALHLVFSRLALPRLSTLHALRRYLAGEQLPPELAAQCQQLLENVHRPQN